MYVKRTHFLCTLLKNELKKRCPCVLSISCARAGPEFPGVGGGEVHQSIIWPNFPGKCMKMEKIEPRGGGRGGGCIQKFIT